MPFQVTNDHNMVENLFHLLTSQCQRAIKHLSQYPASPDDSIHEARLSLKRARTLTLFLREALGEHRFNDTSDMLRRYGQRMSIQRDNFVKASLVREFLEFEEFELPHPSAVDSSDPYSVQQTLEGLSKLIKRLPSAQVEPGGFAKVREAFLDVVRQEKYAHQRAVRTGRDRHYHTWRKRAKHLYHLLRIMQPVKPEKLTRRKKDFCRLTQLLGRIQDISITAENVNHLGLVPRKSGLLVIRLAEARAQATQQAIYLGNEIAIEHPAEFVTGLEKCW